MPFCQALWRLLLPLPCLWGASCPLCESLNDCENDTAGKQRFFIYFFVFHVISCEFKKMMSMFPFLAVYLLEGVLLPLPWISIHEVPQKERLY